MGHSHAEVAHAWAHGMKKPAKGHALFFEGNTIYSYGYHFPIARIVEEEGRLPFVLFTNRNAPSHSTSTHMGIVKGAIPLGWRAGHVPDPSGRVEDQSERIQLWYLHEIHDLVGKAKRSKMWGDAYLIRAESLREEGNSLAERFNLRWRLPEPRDSGATIAEIRQRWKAQKAKSDEAMRRKLRRKVSDWRQGRLPACLLHPDVLLRVKGERVETSRGASFPVSDAKRAWLAIKRCRKEAQGITTVPHEPRIMLGGYGIDSIDHQGNVTAGCHFVKWAEIQRLARTLRLKGATS